MYAYKVAFPKKGYTIEQIRKLPHIISSSLVKNRLRKITYTSRGQPRKPAKKGNSSSEGKEGKGFKEPTKAPTEILRDKTDDVGAFIEQKVDNAYKESESESELQGATPLKKMTVDSGSD